MAFITFGEARYVNSALKESHVIYDDNYTAYNDNYKACRYNNTNTDFFVETKNANVGDTDIFSQFTDSAGKDIKILNLIWKWLTNGYLNLNNLNLNRTGSFICSYTSP